MSSFSSLPPSAGSAPPSSPSSPLTLAGAEAAFVVAVSASSSPPPPQPAASSERTRPTDSRKRKDRRFECITGALHGHAAHARDSPPFGRGKWGRIGNDPGLAKVD